jgi:hypothetical protein
MNTTDIATTGTDYRVTILYVGSRAGETGTYDPSTGRYDSTTNLLVRATSPAEALASAARGVAAWDGTWTPVGIGDDTQVVVTSFDGEEAIVTLDVATHEGPTCAACGDATRTAVDAHHKVTTAVPTPRAYTTRALHLVSNRVETFHVEVDGGRNLAAYRTATSLASLWNGAAGRVIFHARRTDEGAEVIGRRDHTAVLVTAREA